MTAATSFKRNAGKHASAPTTWPVAGTSRTAAIDSLRELGLADVWDDLEEFLGQLVRTDFGIAGLHSGTR